MTTRQNIPAPNPGQEQLPNGYSDNFSEPADDFYIPPCGIEDVDIAMKKLFDVEFGFTTKKLVNGANGPVNIHKPTVVFATGERFAIVKKLRPVKDRNGALMLPAISIRRTSINQSYDDMNKRGINQTTGELIIKRKLSESDRGYQNLLNKIGLKNQTVNEAYSNRTNKESNKNDESIKKGMLLDPKLDSSNVVEIISMPQPQFYSVNYEIVFWTSFVEHMNYMVETLLLNQLPQDKTFKLTTDKGYWFIAKLEENGDSQDNFDDFSEQERIIRYNFNMKVDAFLIASNGPGNSAPFKKYISATQLSFNVSEPIAAREQQLKNLEPTDSDTKFLLTDTTQDEKLITKPTTESRFVYEKEYFDSLTGKRKRKFVKEIQLGNNSSETLYRASDQETLNEYLLSLGTK